MAIAFDLCDLAEQMLTAKLRRDHPDATPTEIERRVVAWYHARPGAEHGDAEGTPGTWPRRP
jgi:hypothetical protein